MVLTLTTSASLLSELRERFQKSFILVLLGPPGSGKGTQAMRLSEELQIPHISTGNLFRMHISEETELGKKAKQFMDRGMLVPDDLVLEMLFFRVGEQDCQKGYILDGFPRTLKQAKAYQKVLGETSKAVIFNLELSDEIIIKRLSGRRVCSGCNAPYHLEYSPPKKEGVCDDCHHELTCRVDDKEEVIQKRLNVYYDQTAPLLEFYLEKYGVTSISCEGSIEEVFHAILQHLKQLAELI